MRFASIEIPARTDQNHTTSVTGGITVRRVQQTADATPSRLLMESLTLEANVLMGLTYATNRIIADSSAAFAEILGRAFADAVRARLIRERIRGTGVGEFLGVVNSPARIVIAKETGQPSDTILFENVRKMAMRCWGFDQAIWLANHDTRSQLAAIGQPHYLYATADDEQDRLLGRPVYYTEFTAALGDEGDLLLVDWSEYVEGTLQPLTHDESMHVRFMAAETAFRFWTRNDGQPWWLAAVTPERGANTPSPYVLLGAR